MLPYLLPLLLLAPSNSALAAHRQNERQPNIIYMLADDLGYGELGCYGQTKIRTPHIDRLSSEGLRFTQHYAGAPVCAPSRCVLLTGRDLAHAEIRGNKRADPEGQFPISAGLVTIPEMLRAKGYTSAAIGKWGLGPVGSSGDPNAQGFDLFFGYNCQREAHSYYPDHLWRNAQSVSLDNGEVPGHRRLTEAPENPFDWENYAAFYGKQYAPDLMMKEAEGFLRERAKAFKQEGEPFFLYLPFVEPHLAMQPPRDLVESYPREWDSEPYLGKKSYTPHPRPRAGYAAMISDLDQHVGDIIALVEELGLTGDTLVIFTSDNGPTHDVGGVDTTFFNSAGPLRGRKGSVYEGGLRVPMIARWPGRIEAGATTGHASAFQDVMPTLAELTGAKQPGGGQGISFLPTLLGKGEQKVHEALVWEFAGYGGQKAVIMGKWKAVQNGLHKKATADAAIELYNLVEDIGESTDVAADHPETVARAARIFREARTPNPNFPMAAYD